MRGRRIFSLNYLFASFFGALLVAGAFAYSNYRFSQYNFVDFSEWLFYEKKDIFTPKYDIYRIVLYSSNMQDFATIKSQIKTHEPLLVLDMFQQKRGIQDDVLYLGAGMNTLLKVIQRFNIDTIPATFTIKKFKKKQYKQDSMVRIIQ